MLEPNQPIQCTYLNTRLSPFNPGSQGARLAKYECRVGWWWVRGKVEKDKVQPRVKSRLHKNSNSWEVSQPSEGLL